MLPSPAAAACWVTTALESNFAAAARAEDGQLRLFDLDEGVRVEVAREWLDSHKGFVALLASVAF